METKISTEDKIKVGISHGDFNGISYEIILKTLADQRMLEYITPVVYGSSKVISYYRKSLNLGDIKFQAVRRIDQVNPKRNNVMNCFDNEVRIEVGKLSPVAGEMALIALDKATDDLKNRNIDALVTAPINKKSIHSEKFEFPGHTEYLAKKFESDDYLMMMISDEIKIGFVTGHVPLSDVSLDSETILSKIEVLHRSLFYDFNIRKPRIALLGLNPHASDQGLIGKEEMNIITPAIEEAQKRDILAFGPYASDGFFGSGNYTKFDGILAMYHDQGMIPFKMISFERGANYTAGLPYVRTSPAHGTAFDIAGKNQASPDSLRYAIFLAVDIFRTREMNSELNANPLRPATGDQNGTIPDDVTNQ